MGVTGLISAVETVRLVEPEVNAEVPMPELSVLLYEFELLKADASTSTMSSTGKLEAWEKGWEKLVNRSVADDVYPELLNSRS